MQGTFEDSMRHIRDDVDAAQKARRAFVEELRITVSEVRADAHSLLDRIRINMQESRQQWKEAQALLHQNLATMTRHRQDVGQDLRAGSRAFQTRQR